MNHFAQRSSLQTELAQVKFIEIHPPYHHPLPTNACICPCRNTIPGANMIQKYLLLHCEEWKIRCNFFINVLQLMHALLACLLPAQRTISNASIVPYKCGNIVTLNYMDSFKSTSTCSHVFIHGSRYIQSVQFSSVQFDTSVVRSA